MQETTILKNHSIRPLNLLAIFERKEVEKLVIIADKKILLVPLTHSGEFRHESNRQKLTFDDFRGRPLTSFPVCVTYFDDPDYVNMDDDILPSNCRLRVEGLVREQSLLVGRCLPHGSDDTCKAFQLPVRTKIDVNVEKIRSLVRYPDISPRNDNAEQITKDTYRNLMMPFNMATGASIVSEPRPIVLPRNIATRGERSECKKSAKNELNNVISAL